MISILLILCIRSMSFRRLINLSLPKSSPVDLQKDSFNVSNSRHGHIQSELLL